MSGTENLPNLPGAEKIKALEVIANLTISKSTSDKFSQTIAKIADKYNETKNAKSTTGKAINVAETIGTIATSDLVKDTGVIIAAALTTGPGAALPAAVILYNTGVKSAEINKNEVLTQEYYHLNDYKINKEAKNAVITKIASNILIDTSGSINAKQLQPVQDKIRDILGLEDKKASTQPAMYEIKNPELLQTFKNTVAVNASQVIVGTVLKAVASGSPVGIGIEAAKTFTSALVDAATQSAEKMTSDEKISFIKQSINELRKEVPAYKTHENYEKSETIFQQARRFTVGGERKVEKQEVSRKYDLANIALEEKAKAMALTRIMEFNEEFKVNLKELINNPENKSLQDKIIKDFAKATQEAKKDIQGKNGDKYYNKNKTDKPTTLRDITAGNVKTVVKLLVKAKAVFKNHGVEGNFERVEESLTKNAADNKEVRSDADNIQKKVAGIEIRESRIELTLKDKEEAQGKLNKAEQHLDSIKLSADIRNNKIDELPKNTSDELQKDSINFKNLFKRMIGVKNKDGIGVVEQQSQEQEYKVDIKQLIDKNEKNPDALSNYFNNFNQEAQQQLKNIKIKVNDKEVNLVEYANYKNAPKEVFKALVQGAEVNSIPKERMEVLLDTIIASQDTKNVKSNQNQKDKVNIVNDFLVKVDDYQKLQLKKEIDSLQKQISDFDKKITSNREAIRRNNKDIEKISSPPQIITIGGASKKLTEADIKNNPQKQGPNDLSLEEQIITIGGASKKLTEADNKNNKQKKPNSIDPSSMRSALENSSSGSSTTSRKLFNYVTFSQNRESQKRTK